MLRPTTPRAARFLLAAGALALTGPAPGCAGAEPAACYDDARDLSAPEQVVPGHHGTFACVDPADFDDQLKLTLDGQGRLITTWVRDGANALGTYGYLDGALRLADDAGWTGVGTALVVADGRLVRFALATRDCVAVTLWGPCGVAGTWDCPAVETADGPATWTVELSADRGVLISEVTPLGSRFDWGIYLVDDEGRFRLRLPRAKLAPGLPGLIAAAGAPGAPLTLTGPAAGPLVCAPR